MSGPLQPLVDDAAQTSAARRAVDAGCRALAAGDPGRALPWLDRAHRLAPNDPTAALLLGSALASTNPALGEAILLQASALHPFHRGILTALASGALRRGEIARAAQRLHTLLCGGAPPSGAAFVTLATAIADAAGAPGWIGLSSSGGAAVYGKRVTLCLDGTPLKKLSPAAGGVRRLDLPAGWAAAAALTAASGGVPLIGSAIDIRALLRVEGCITRGDTHVEGWVWHPNDPEAPVSLSVHASGETAPVAAIMATDLAVTAGGGDDAAPRRHFVLDAEMIRQAAGPYRHALSLRGPDGTPIPGGPIVSPTVGVSGPERAAGRRGPSRTATDGLHVILPMTGGHMAMQACLDSLARHGMAEPPLIVAVDAGEACDDLRSLVTKAGGTCLRGVSDGVPAALNAGLRHAAAAATQCDVLVLSAPCTLAPGLPARLKAALQAGQAVGIAQPVHGDPVSPDGQDARYQQCNAGVQPIVAAVSGPCIAVDGACLCDMQRLEKRLLRDDLFVGASAAFADFSLRAGQLGWASVLVCEAILRETAATASSAIVAALGSRDHATLIRLHGTAAAALEDLAAAAAMARRRVAMAAWQEARGRAGAVVLVTHADGGGVERYVRERTVAIQTSGKRPIVIRCSDDPQGEAVWAVSDGTGDTHPDLRFRASGDLDALAGLLQGDRPAAVEFHHGASHDQIICGLAARLGIPYDVFVHDFAAICPRVTFVGGSGRYCGEPADVTECDDCVADHGVRIGRIEPVATLRARSARLLGGARRIVVPAADAARRLCRYFPAVTPEIVPWQDDGQLTANVPRQPMRAPGRTPADPMTICVAGAVGQDKGYDVILACARDASRRNLNLTFTVVGHTIDDARLLDTGRVFVTGRYQEDEAVALIRAQRADIGFLPSVWPETWCYALSALWQAGLWTVAFALGAPAERIAATGAGRSVPLGMPAGRLNDFMLGLLPVSGRATRAASHG